MTLPQVQSVDREPIVYNNKPNRVQTLKTTGAFFLAKPTSR